MLRLPEVESRDGFMSHMHRSKSESKNESKHQPKQGPLIHSKDRSEVHKNTDLNSQKHLKTGLEDPEKGMEGVEHPEIEKSKTEDIKQYIKKPARKERNWYLRQRQIDEYKSIVCKESRNERSLRRHNELEESPKKKKRVSFEF